MNNLISAKEKKCALHLTLNCGRWTILSVTYGPIRSVICFWRRWGEFVVTIPKFKIVTPIESDKNRKTAKFKIVRILYNFPTLHWIIGYLSFENVIKNPRWPTTKHAYVYIFHTISIVFILKSVAVWQKHTNRFFVGPIKSRFRHAIGI